MLPAIDDFLIDRVFQPVADRLSGCISCYRLAFYLLWIGWLVMFSQTTTNLPIGICVAFGWLPWVTHTSYVASTADRRTRVGVIPDSRIILEFSRRWFLVAGPILAFTGVYADDWFVAIGICICPVAALFASCRRNPPKSKRSFVPAGMLPLPTVS